MLNLYKPLVRSRLEYGVEIWSPHLKKQIHEVESVQRRATRMIPSQKERLWKLKLLTLVYRKKRGKMTQTYKYLHGLYDSSTEQLFMRTQENRTRGHDMILFKERVHTSTREKFFTSRLIDSWTALPQHMGIWGGHSQLWLYQYQLNSCFDMAREKYISFPIRVCFCNFLILNLSQS